MKPTTAFYTIASMALGVSLVALSFAHAEDMASTYRSNLADLYFAQVNAEGQDWDIQDSNYLQGRGVNALNGGDIYPRDWREVPVVSATPAELEAARQKLNYAISSGAVNTMPRDFSHALVGYDCWVGQQKAEPNASHNLYSCKDEYNRYAANLPNPATTKQVTTTTTTPMVMKELHKVYFAWDSYALNADSKAKLNDAREMLLDHKNGKLVIGGYADASGTRAYNQKLSERRAQAVVNYLGLSPTQYEINASAYGEDGQQVRTANGVREAANRVVILGIRMTHDVTTQETTTVPLDNTTTY